MLKTRSTARFNMCLFIVARVHDANEFIWYRISVQPNSTSSSTTNNDTNINSIISFKKIHVDGFTPIKIVCDDDNDDYDQIDE